MDTTAPAIEAIAVRKAFGATTVLDAIDLAVAPGSVFALLGPNGAGKTTAVHILTTLLAADGGTARVHGHDVVRDAEAVRGLIGVTGQFSAVDALLTGEENLRLMADLRHLTTADGRRRTAELLAQFELEDAARKPLAAYSGGMRRRLDLAMTLVARPAVIFLDEPTTGLDPRSRRTMWDIVRGLVADGTTVFLTTQYLEEADELADHVAVLDRGRLVADGSPDELKRLVPGGRLRMRLADEAAYREAAARFPGAERDDDALALALPGASDVRALKRTLDVLDEAAIAVEEVAVQSPTLDDVFFALTGHGASASEAITTEAITTEATTTEERSA